MFQGKRFEKVLAITAILFAFVAAGPLYAESHKHSQKASTTEMSKSKEACESTAKEGCLLKAADLIGSDVKIRALAPVSTEAKGSPAAQMNPQPAGRAPTSPLAERIGTVGDLVICGNTHKVAYVTVMSQGKCYPVPWWAFDVRSGSATSMSGSQVENPALAVRYGQGWLSSGVWTSEAPTAAMRHVLFLNVTSEQLREAPTIASTIPLEKLSDLKLIQRLDSFYSQYTGRQASHMAAPAGPAKLLKVSSIRGLKVQDSHNVGVGRIQDLLVDARGGELAYGLVRFGGFAGIARKTAAVPWASLNIQMERGYAGLDGGRERLSAAVIDENHLEKLAQPEFARRIHETFGASPYWEVFGFVPGEESKAPMNPWSPQSAYNKSFNVGTLTTIEGTTKDVSTFYPDGGAAPGTRLVVVTKDGQSMTVDVGPRAFAAQNGIEFKLDSQISATGSKTKIDGESVIMASEIRVDGKMLKLRDAQGVPQWKVEDLPPED